MKKIIFYLPFLFLSFPSLSLSAYFHDVELHSVSSGDTIVVSIPDLPEIFSKRIPIVLNGVDVPKKRGRCYGEDELAGRARDRLAGLLFKGKVISIANAKRDIYFRLIANVRVDNADVSEVLIREGLAKIGNGQSKTDWCSYRRQGRLKN